MKATAWLWPVVTLLCGSQFVCTVQGEYQEFVDSSMMQDDFMLEKRTKPSLSIVNPLDVLRQRLLLEIARRQMKENTRQVEINRAILKNVGKRVNRQKVHPPESNFYDLIRRADTKKDATEKGSPRDDVNSFEQSNDIGNDDYQIRYLYRLHKNRYARK